MKPNTRMLDYTALVQDGVLTLDDVPQDVKGAVTKWVRYLSGVEDDSMVKDEPAPAPTPAPTVQKATVDTKPLLPKVGD